MYFYDFPRLLKYVSKWIVDGQNLQTYYSKIASILSIVKI